MWDNTSDNEEMAVDTSGLESFMTKWGSTPSLHKVKSSKSLNASKISRSSSFSSSSSSSQQVEKNNTPVSRRRPAPAKAGADQVVLNRSASGSILDTSNTSSTSTAPAVVPSNPLADLSDVFAPAPVAAPAQTAFPSAVVPASAPVNLLDDAFGAGPVAQAPVPVMAPMGTVPAGSAMTNTNIMNLNSSSASAVPMSPTAAPPSPSPLAKDPLAALVNLDLGGRNAVDVAKEQAKAAASAPMMIGGPRSTGALW